VTLNRLAVALWVFNFGIPSPPYYICNLNVLPSPPAALTLSFSGPPDTLSLRDPALFAFGDKPSLFARLAQDTTFVYLFAETLEQALL
jgi:hypothetical protein